MDLVVELLSVCLCDGHARSVLAGQPTLVRSAA
jgi:hypothetical protein